MVNFRKLNVTGCSKEEAVSKAPFNILGDATTAYRKWANQFDRVNDADITQFMLDYLEAKTKNTPGNGFIITLEPAVTDNRKYPYTYKKFDIKKGLKHYRKVYRWYEEGTSNIICEVYGKLSDAKNAMKQVIANGFKGRVELVREQVNRDGREVMATMEYTPSIRARIGSYLIFGFES